LSANFVVEVTFWHKMWENYIKPLDSTEYLDSMGPAQDFYSSVTEAIKISATLPALICSIERLPSG